MNDIRPFRGIRFDQSVAGALGSVLCPPYDVISPEEQASLYRESTHNVVRLELGKEKLNDNPSNNRYTRAALTLQRWVARGVLKEEQDPALYVHEQQFSHEGRTLVRRGLFGCLRLAQWKEGVVLPHEETLAKPKADRLQLMRATACNLSPVFLLFDDPSGTMAELLAAEAEARPDAAADMADGDRHRLWVVRGDARRKLVEALARPQLYVADGHHRYETALAYRDEMRKTADADIASLPSPLPAYDFALVLLVDSRDPGLLVLPTHRVVRSVSEAALAALNDGLSPNFDVLPVAVEGIVGLDAADLLVRRMRELEPDGCALGLYRRGMAPVILRPRATAVAMPADGRPLLDVDVLHGLVLERLLGIGADRLRAGSHVAYTRDAAEAVLAVDRNEGQAAFLLNATRVDQVLATARAGDKMPQKSTYFHPKPATGLVIKPLTGSL